MPEVLTIAGPAGVPDLLPLFEHVQEMQPVLLPIMSQPLLGEISESFQRHLVTSWREHLASTSMGAERIGFVSDFLAGGFLSVMHRWLAAGCDRSPADVCAEHQKYVDAILVEALT
jgi:hypothetical protein